MRAGSEIARCKKRERERERWMGRSGVLPSLYLVNVKRRQCRTTCRILNFQKATCAHVPQTGARAADEGSDGISTVL